MAELNGAMAAIEIAFSKGWFNLWLETDAKLVVQAFQDENVIPWYLKTRWKNCIILSSKMRFIVSHVFRERNSCGDGLASQP